MKNQTQKNLEGKNAGEEDYEDIEDPNFFKFENVGDKIAGKLVDIGNSDQYGFGLYTVEKSDGEQVRFHGSSQLDSRMKQVQLGDSVIVEFMDIEKRPKGNMKLFNVRRKKA
jgi:hypothetical protein